MATIGNNSDANNARLREAFLSEDEVEYVGEMVQHIRQGRSVEGVSMSSVGMKNFLEIYNRAVAKLEKLKLDINIEGSLKQQLRYILGLEGDGSKMINLIDGKQVKGIYRQDNRMKNILAETLIELVDEGKFNEEQMACVENQLGLMLATIQDIHNENIFER